MLVLEKKKIAEQTLIFPMDKDDEAFFVHCAGSKSVSERDFTSRVSSIIQMHNIHYIVQPTD